jgi:class 3 adenylate cyclase
MDSSSPDASHDLLAGFSERDRRLFERAVRQLQAHSALAAMDPDNAAAQELYRWAELGRNYALLENFFRISGIGLRRHEGFQIIQLSLEEDADSHPLRRRLDKDQTGLLICLWLLYHEKMRETDGFRIVVTIEDIYARLAAIFGDDRRLPETPFREALRFFEKHSLVELNLDGREFPQAEVALLPTILSTFVFTSADEAKNFATSSPSPK